MTTAGIHYQPNNFDRYDGHPPKSLSMQERRVPFNSS